MRIIVWVILAIQSLVFGAAAQDTTTPEAARPTLAEPVTGETAAAVLSRLSDSEVRAVLLERLEAEAEAEGALEDDDILEKLEEGAVNLATSFGVSLSRITVIPGILHYSWQTFADGRPWFGAYFAGALALAVGAGLVAAWGARHLLRHQRKRDDAPPTDTGLGERVRALLRRALFDLAELAAFMVVARIVIALCFSRENDTEAAGDLLIALTALGAVRLGTRFVLAPQRPALRLIHADDALAKFLSRRVLLICAVSLAGGWLLEWTFLNGVQPGYARIGFWFNLITMALLADTLWRARDGLTRMMIGDNLEVGSTESRIARHWPAICAVQILLLWLTVEIIVANAGVIPALREGADGLTLIMLVMAPVIDTAVRGIASLAAPVPDADDPPGLTEARRITRRGLVRIGRVLAAVVIIVLIARAWGLNLIPTADDGLGARLVGETLGIISILLISYAMWEVSEVFYGRQKAFDDALRPAVDPDEPGGGEGGGVGGSRASTVAPLLRGAVQFCIVVFTVFAVLSELGLNIAALVAGAGVIGLAIGFGAQTLVRDIVSGLFFLLDDAFRVGEYIEIGDTRGTVEKISVRSLRLRHHRGAVHTIPYGEIAKLTNYSRDWTIMKLSFRVPFDADVEKIRKIFKKIGQELLKDPEIGGDFIQPFKSQGVSQVDDSGMILRGKFMTKPGKQFMARKKIFVAVQRAFHENGIPFARKEVRVHVPGLEESTTPDIHRAVAGAAQEAAAEPTP